MRISQILVKFTTDRSEVRRGFRLRFEERSGGGGGGGAAGGASAGGDDPCSWRGVELTETSGTITSPGFGGDGYPNDARCEWRVVAPEGKVSRVTTGVLELQVFYRCPHVKLFNHTHQSRKTASFTNTRPSTSKHMHCTSDVFLHWTERERDVRDE